VKVLVTGSAGFIGQHVTAELKARGHTVVPFDRPQDIGSYLTVDKAFAVHEPDAVINLAGALGTPELFGAERHAAQVNILGALNVYTAAARLKIPVVQIGTGHKGQPNPYAITKACAEDLGLARAQWCGEKITVVRAFHVYGAGQIPGPPHGPAAVHKFFPTFACRALSGLPLELCGGGTQLIDPVHASSVAVSLIDAIAGPYGTVTEAGTGKGFTVAQVAADIAAVCDPTVPLVETAGRAGEPFNADVVAAVPVCRDPWPYMVAETVDWYRQWLASHS
jgi:nucleoside-diphosphate-sugar epimerase